MICIAESGSTKTIWIILDPATHSETARFHSQGLNPFFVDAQVVARTFSETFPKGMVAQLQTIFFYGAGCSSVERKRVISDGLGACAPTAKIYVEHDLLAAARATCKSDAGVTCILGTGSNSCLYNGAVITDNVPSLGYALGDEGSGSDIGRRLVTAWLYREMPAPLAEAFVSRFLLTKESVLNAVYSQPQPNRYLAQFTSFCSDYRGEAVVEEIITQALTGFIDRHVMKYKLTGGECIHFVGSVAFHFRDILQILLTQRGLTMGLAIKSPIDELVNYHASHGF